MRMVVVGVALVVGWFSVPPAPADTQPAAEVDGVAIDRAAVQHLVKGLASAESAPPDSARIAALTDKALDSLIDLELLYQEAKRRQIRLSEEAVDREIGLLRQHFSDRDEFAKALRRRGMDEGALRADTHRTLLVDELLRRTVWQDVDVSAAEVRRFFEENRARLSDSLAELHDSIARMLLVDKKARLRSDLVLRLRSRAKITKFPPFGPAPKEPPHKPAAADPQPQ